MKMYRCNLLWIVDTVSIDMSSCVICVCMRVQMDQWVTQRGTDPLPLEEEHCSVVEVTEEEIKNSVKFVPSLSAVVRNPECPPFTQHFSIKLIHLRSSFPREVKL